MQSTKDKNTKDERTNEIQQTKENIQMIQMIKITKDYEYRRILTHISLKSKDKSTKGLKNTKRKNIKIKTAGSFTSCFL